MTKVEFVREILRRHRDTYFISNDFAEFVDAAFREEYQRGAADNAYAVREQLTKIAQTPDIPHMSAVSTERLHALAGPGQYPDAIRERLMGEV